MCSIVDYAAMRQCVIDKGVIYVPPHRWGLLEPCVIAAAKFLTYEDSYSFVWRIPDNEMFDRYKSENIAMYSVFRARIMGKHKWLWRRYYWIRRILHRYFNV